MCEQSSASPSEAGHRTASVLRRDSSFLGDSKKHEGGSSRRTSFFGGSDGAYSSVVVRASPVNSERRNTRRLRLKHRWSAVTVS